MTARRRVFLLSLCLPLAFTVTGILAYQYRIDLSNRMQAGLSLPNASAPTKQSSIIIFAPHCDDETIATGGLIHLALKDGARVKVVVLTNGDGFRVATELEYRDVRPSPSEYIRFAEERQRDVAAAAATMGLPRRALIYLGYPDRGLMAMWVTNWSPMSPFRSKYTKLTRSPYRNAYRRNALYCGQSLFEDIRSILAEYKPTDVYVTHPSDDHSDHAAAYAFVAAALDSLAGDAKAPKTRVHTYLAHRGEWPSPMGFKPKAPLRPPFAMAKLDTDWDILPLDRATVLLKKKAIMRHKSQVRVMRKYLLSFARRNELFGDIRPAGIAAVPDGRMVIDGEPGDWTGIRPVEKDPVADKLLRAFEKAGDLRRIYLCADESNLYVRLDFRRNLSKRALYRITIRSFGETPRGESTRLWTATVKPPSRCVPAGTYFAWQGPVLELMVPRSELDPADRVFICADTSVMRLKIDNSGWRGCAFRR
ncbi:MAG: PIG-L family deacetylase [Armatimonadota bacterium]|nr:PIG-L family deacetylase [Armatimonadota bacterium]